MPTGALKPDGEGKRVDPDETMSPPPSPTPTRVSRRAKDWVAWYQDIVIRRERLLDRIKGKEVFGTGEVALLVNVAPRTVNQWFDAGRLRGEREGRSRRRQVLRTELLRFLREHGMPVPEGLDGVGQAASQDREDVDFEG
jgi:hypothetical protein